MKLVIGIVAGVLVGLALAPRAPVASKEDPVLSAVCERYKESGADTRLQALREQAKGLKGRGVQFDPALENEIFHLRVLKHTACGQTAGW